MQLNREGWWWLCINHVFIRIKRKKNCFVCNFDWCEMLREGNSYTISFTAVTTQGWRVLGDWSNTPKVQSCLKQGKEVCVIHVASCARRAGPTWLYEFLHYTLQYNNAIHLTHLCWVSVQFSVSVLKFQLGVLNCLHHSAFCFYGM